jgi:hypothetical protein
MAPTVPTNQKTPARLPPLNNIELPLLLELVNNNKTIIESRMTNAVWTTKKQATWIKIQKAFVSQSGTVFRNPDQLKKCWENLKTKAKREVIITLLIK